jgi:hypothetical protein
LTLHDTNYVIAWQNALTKVLKAIGVNAAAAPAPTFEDVIARMQHGDEAA